jgi:hypothetical protein
MLCGDNKYKFIQQEDEPLQTDEEFAKRVYNAEMFEYDEDRDAIYPFPTLD